MKRKGSVILFGFLSLIAPVVFPNCYSDNPCASSFYNDGVVAFCFE